MSPQHALALVLLPGVVLVTAVLATWSQRVRDLFFFLVVTLAVVAERLDVNFFSAAWYRGTTRGLQISLPEILAFAVLVGSLLARRVAGERPRWFWPGSLGLILLSLLYAVISVITSQPKIFGVFELTALLGNLVVFLAAATYLRTRREWTILLVALACAVGFEGLWAVRQKATMHIDRVTGTLDHANSLSMFFCLATPPLVAAAYAGWTRALRWFAGAAAGCATVGLMLTISRAGLPVFIVVCLGTFVTCATWKLEVRQILVRTGVAVALVALVVAMWGPIVQRYGEASVPDEYLDPKMDGRGVYLRLAGNISRDHFFGVGLNNWSYHVSRSYGPEVGFRFQNYDELTAVYGTNKVQKIFGDSYLAAPAHNLAALTLGELGVPGLFLFLLLWARWFSMGVPFLFSRRGPPVRTLGVGIFFGFCGIFGQSLTEWVFRQAPIAITFHVLLGALASLAYVRRTQAASLRTAPAAAPTFPPATTLAPRII